MAEVARAKASPARKRPVDAAGALAPAPPGSPPPTGQNARKTQSRLSETAEDLDDNQTISYSITPCGLGLGMLALFASVALAIHLGPQAEDRFCCG